MKHLALQHYLYTLAAAFFILISPAAYGQAIPFTRITELSKSDKLREEALNSADPVDYLVHFNQFPALQKYRKEHIFSIRDSIFGDVPFRLYIPKSYDATRPTPLVLLLHGAVGGSRFSDADGTYDITGERSDPFYEKLCQTGYIVIMPYADPGKGFDWVANRHRPRLNPTFKSLVAIIEAVKGVLNVDDNKVFAFGHSDGSDGAFALSVYAPTVFAGFIGYNSMLTNLFADNFYIRNAVNRKLFLVHSDQDGLRPIEQNRPVIKYLDSIKASITYKEYHGYKHYDKHLILDYPRALQFMDSVKRNPFTQTVFWETNNHVYNQCGWLVVTDWNLNKPRADWAKPNNITFFNKTNNSWLDRKYYDESPSAAIKASYQNNLFEISTSGVTAFKLLISPGMVDLKQTVKVIVNGKMMFASKVLPDKNFLIAQFLQNHDRQALWVTSVTINVPD